MLIVDAVSQLTRDRHGVKRGSHDLSGTTAKSGIACLRLDQFGVGKNDTQLIVEAMEQRPRALGLEGGILAGSLGRAHGHWRHE